MNSDTLPDKLFFKPSELAEMLSISVKTIYGMIDQGRLDAVRIGGRTVRIPRQAVMNIIEEINA
jgi:excisionase family DNA binding protein